MIDVVYVLRFVAEVAVELAFGVTEVRTNCDRCDGE